MSVCLSVCLSIYLASQLAIHSNPSGTLSPDTMSAVLRIPPVLTPLIPIHNHILYAQVFALLADAVC